MNRLLIILWLSLATIAFGKDATIVLGPGARIENARIESDADPVILVTGDNAVLSNVEIIGAGKPSQRGVFSESGKRGRIDGCKFSKLGIGVKLDKSADSWSILRSEFAEIVGVTDGTGYGILVGLCDHGEIGFCRFAGSPGHGRHGVYLSGGASRWWLHDYHGDRSNSSTIAIYALQHHEPCEANVIERTWVTNQAKGQDGTAGIEISGKTTGTIVRDCLCSNVDATGLVVSTQGWIDRSNVTIENLTVDGCSGDGIFLRGARGVRIVDSDIRNVSRSSLGQKSCINLQAWYQGQPKQATSDVLIVRNRLGTQGARAAVTLNPTEPRPINVVQESNQIEK